MRSSSGAVHQRHANSPFSPEVTWMRTTKKWELVKAQAQAQAPAPARETLLAPVAQALATWHLSGEPGGRVLYGFCIICPTHAGRRCPSPALPNVRFGGLGVWGLSPICQTLQHAFRCAFAPRLLSVHRLIPFQATLSPTAMTAAICPRGCHNGSHALIDLRARVFWRVHSLAGRRFLSGSLSST